MCLNILFLTHLFRCQLQQKASGGKKSKVEVLLLPGRALGWEQGRGKLCVLGCSCLEWSLRLAVLGEQKDGEVLVQTLDSHLSYYIFIDFLDQMFLHLLFSLRIISRGFKLLLLLKISLTSFTRERVSRAPLLPYWKLITSTYILNCILFLLLITEIVQVPYKTSQYYRPL